MLVRTAQPGDLRALMELSATLPPGMTSMPCDQPAWEKKLESVAASMQESPDLETERVYLMVMEEPESGRVVGTSGVMAAVGQHWPFYNYKLSTEVNVSAELGIRRTSRLLNLVNDFTGETELISLLLLPEFRARHLSQFLARCGFVLMSDFPEHFTTMVFAEVRGWLDQYEQSPFWEHLGRKFFDLPYARADFLSAVNGSQFISDLMPCFPVYLELLPEAAVEVIGRPHNESAPAQKLIEKEGFRYENIINVFDAGPVMQCHRENIESVKNSRLLTVGRVNSRLSMDDESRPLYMVSNCRLEDYRLTITPVETGEDGSAAIPARAATLLGVEPGEQIRILEMR